MGELRAVWRIRGQVFLGMGGQKESGCLENTENTSVFRLFLSGLSEANRGNSRLQTLTVGVEIRLPHFQPLDTPEKPGENSFSAIFDVESTHKFWRGGPYIIVPDSEVRQ